MGSFETLWNMSVGNFSRFPCQDVIHEEIIYIQEENASFLQNDIPHFVKVRKELNNISEKCAYWQSSNPKK